MAVRLTKGGRRDEKENFTRCPEHCFIYNKDVNEIPMSKKVDKQWYVKLARKRLEDFGYVPEGSMKLF